ncbi:hypothetical protein, partial [Pseudomonas aeruginosa]|uniref:hypothetical protein n=1 Tax=Pseudomonas aeruginosa TaxID=287 RepID=UPI001E3CCDE6
WGNTLPKWSGVALSFCGRPLNSPSNTTLTLRQSSAGRQRRLGRMMLSYCLGSYSRALYVQADIKKGHPKVAYEFMLQ